MKYFTDFSSEYSCSIKKYQPAEMITGDKKENFYWSIL